MPTPLDMGARKTCEKMMTVELPYFGEIDNQSPSEHYEAQITFGGRPLRLDINCRPGQPVEQHRLAVVGSILDDLEEWNRLAVAAILKDFENGGEAAYYVDEFLELLENETVEILLADADASKTPREQTLSVLHLKRVGFYPDPLLYPKEEGFVIFDYTIGSEIVDHLVVVEYRFDGSLLRIDVES